MEYGANAQKYTNNATRLKMKMVSKSFIYVCAYFGAGTSDLLLRDTGDSVDGQAESLQLPLEANRELMQRCDDAGSARFQLTP